MNTLRNAILASCMICYSFTLFSQDFMMQGWYWDYPKTGCNAYVGPTHAATLSTQVTALANGGFTYLWLPPASKASFGDCSNGYDPKDLYDLGQVSGQTGFGTGTQVMNLITALNGAGIQPVADVVYNHRDGGAFEDNPAARNYHQNYPNGCGTATPYPVNGKARYRLPVSGTCPGGVCNYYFKFSSASGNPGFYNRPYKLYFQTSVVGYQNLPAINEVEPNGGGDCNPDQPSQTIPLGVDILATIDSDPDCRTDEFHIALTNAQLNPAGDFIELYIEEINGGGTGIDIRPYGIWSTKDNADIIGQFAMQTRTDFSGLPSGDGAMNYLNFKPNGINPTCMTGDEDFPYFFFDVETRYQNTRDIYNQWSQWLIEDMGFGGLRMDAVKHFEPPFVGQLLDYLSSVSASPSLVVGEFFDGSPTLLKGWVDAVNASKTSNDVPVRVFDFAMRNALKDACDGINDKRNLFNSGLVDAAGMSGFSVVTFINNHDFRGPGEPLQNDPMLAYAYILTNNKIGLPCVFYPDYFGVPYPNAPNVNLQTQIDELMDIHSSHIFGGTVDYLNRFSSPYAYLSPNNTAGNAVVYQIKGGPGGKDVIVAINFGGAGGNFQINQQLNTFGINVGDAFTKIAGNATTMQPVIEAMSPNGIPLSVFLELPPRSYAVFLHQGPLSLDLTELKGNLDGKDAILNWKIASESSIQSFDIQRSDNGVKFEDIGTIQLNNEGKLDFQFRDSQFPGDAYYRIKVSGRGGDEKLSNIIHLKDPAHYQGFRVSPNPISPSAEGFSIQNLNNQDEWIQDATLTRHDGALIISGMQGSAQDLSNRIQQLLQQQSPAIYMLSLSTRKGTQHVKLLKL
jgi:glycosidase